MASRQSIFLIEDSPGECELFRLALLQAGPGVHLRTAPDMDSAFRSLETLIDGQAVVPSLILLDLKLGGQHGCDFLHRLRADARFVHLPVVVFTTSDDPADIAICHANGANGYVVKPGTFDELVHCTADLCRYWLQWNRTPQPARTPC